MASLRRDSTGQGFLHVGSDNVARTLDRLFQVVDAAPLDTGAVNWNHTPNAHMLKEIKQATARSSREFETRPSKPRHVFDNRQESCVSENCPNDEYCQDLYIYGYNCSYCLIISSGIGNCQEI